MEPWMRKRRRACRTGSRMTVTVSRVTGGRFISKMKPKQAPPVFLLTTTGRRSGKPRTVALSYMKDEDETPITVGTYGGLPTEPAWVLNLRASPEAVMQVDGNKTPVTASFIEGDEWSSTWDRILTEYPLYKDALATVDRDVPIIRLHPRQHDAPST